jgi:16S rRNA (uracil1498-N3)-methyltransferase
LRLYVEDALGSGLPIAPSDAQAHYLLHVMRAKPGDRVCLFNGRDGEWLASIAKVAKKSCTLVCAKQTRPQSGTPDVWLCFAPIKKTPADYVVQKATELGVSALVPVFTRRTIVTRVNSERMTANAIEAAEQSDRLTVPQIREPVSLEKLLASWPRERRIVFCDEGGDAKPIAEALASFFPPPQADGGNSFEHGELGENGVDDAASPLPRVDPLRARKGKENNFPVAILTGPEGGFDPAERARIRVHDFVTPVTLGPRILRADTAALASIAVLQALAGDWR